MSAERNDLSPVRKDEAETIDLEMVDTPATGAPRIDIGGESMTAEDLMKLGPGMLAKTLRGVILEKFKKWFIRNLVIVTILSLLVMEYKGLTWLLYVWLFLAGIQLAFLVFGWYFVNKQSAKFADMMKGMNPGGGAGDRNF